MIQILLPESHDTDSILPKPLESDSKSSDSESHMIRVLSKLLMEILSQILFPESHDSDFIPLKSLDSDFKSGRFRLYPSRMIRNLLVTSCRSRVILIRPPFESHD